MIPSACLSRGISNSNAKMKRNLFGEENKPKRRETK